MILENFLLRKHSSEEYHSIIVLALVLMEFVATALIHAMPLLILHIAFAASL